MFNDGKLNVLKNTIILIYIKNIEIGKPELFLNYN